MTALLHPSGLADAGQIAKIHVLAKNAGLDEDCRRALMASVTGKRSARDLTSREAALVIDRLKELPGAASKGVRGAVAIDGPYGPKLRALWISAYNLGVVRDRTDAAMLSFVERQTGISRTRWLRDAADARAAVEGLKGWIGRAAGVVWPAGDDPIEIRMAVIEAQCRRLTELGQAWDYTLDPGSPERDLDAAISGLGAKLRRAVKGRAP